MAVADIQIALYGHYEPTGVYSFEFRTQKGDVITEIFFVLPPENVTVVEPQRSSLIPTLRGGYYVDFGNDFKEIKISGSSHFYHAGSTNNPSKEFGSSENIGVEGYIDGYSEFIKLRYMVIRYRDYTMTPDGKIVAPNFGVQDLSRVNALKLFVQQEIEGGSGALADNIEVIWHDYDYDDHFKVRVDSFSVTRDKKDPFTIMYDLSLQGYAVDTRTASRVIFRQPTKKKKTPPEFIRESYLNVSEVHAYSVPDSLNVVSPGNVYTISNVALEDVENTPTIPEFEV